jgi:2-polyprenyl-3-methyl-5-hydroxy-6-metoxy-1,4-benzoquinol methylase/glycosyltransferase involved in cell wall biosynthesis
VSVLRRCALAFSPLANNAYFQKPKSAAYKLARAVLFRFPKFRQAVQRQRRKFDRWLRGLPPLSKNDLNWKSFSTEVLGRRDQFKGIFVQEPTVDWNIPLYQRPQHMSAALGRRGYLVIYKTYNVCRDDVDGFREITQNVWLTNKDEVNDIEGVVRSFYSTAYANWPDLMLRNSKRGVLVYEYIDHLDPQISGDDESILRLQEMKDFCFSGGADYIVASARKLEREALEAVDGKKVVLIPNGVDTRHYRDPIHQQTTLPDTLMSFRSKYSNIVGYFGAIAPWLWYQAISELVHSRPDLGFVFIGPEYNEGCINQLPQAENVLYLGAVEYKILPSYARQFDVCWIPFATGEIARTTSPLKLFEYFALEKPVVATSEMLECVAFKEVFRGDSANALSQAIDEAVKIKSNPAFKARLAQLADENDWNERARAMDITFQQTLHKDIAKTCGVSEEFIELYLMRQNLTKFRRSNWHDFCEALDPLTKMYVQFAMTTVTRGRELGDLLKAHSCIENRGRYLDVGAGYGGFLKAFKEIGFRDVVGIELQEHLVAYAISNVKGIAGAQVLHMDFEKADCSGLGAFDLITCNDVIEHVKDPALTIRKMVDLLAVPGCLCLEVPNSNSISFVQSDGHFQLFGITQLPREEAATYYSEVMGQGRSSYLFEMGESYELDWYLQRMTDSNLRSKTVDRHQTGHIHDVPKFIADLKLAYQGWRDKVKPKLSLTVAQSVTDRIDHYLDQLEKDFSEIKGEKSAARFTSRYLMTFWTILARR